MRIALNPSGTAYARYRTHYRGFEEQSASRREPNTELPERLNGPMLNCLPGWSKCLRWPFKKALYTGADRRVVTSAARPIPPDPQPWVSSNAAAATTTH